MAPYVYIRNDRFTALPAHEQPAVPFPYFIRHGPRADDFVIDEVLDRLVDEAVGFIDRSSRAGDPFFLYFPLTAPHKPTQPHERFRGRTAWASTAISWCRWTMRSGRCSRPSTGPVPATRRW